MKKSTLVLASMLAMSTASKADEGMWTLFNLPEAVYTQMVDYGFSLPCDRLYNSPNAISNYVVNFSGFCSGVVVSPDGLVFTNHHCGFGAINAHSTVEHDYMRDGFYAKSFAEELPNKDTFVSFMRAQDDITSRIAPLIVNKSLKQQGEIIDSVENVLNDSIKKIDKTLHIEVAPFYEGNKYYATHIKTLPMFALYLPYQRVWVNLVETLITGCGHVRLATSQYSEYMPTLRLTDLHPTLKIMCHITQNTSHP